MSVCSRPARGVRLPSPFDTPPFDKLRTGSSAATQGEERGVGGLSRSMRKITRTGRDLSLRSSSLDSKTNPPYPPLSGGQEKSKPPQPGRGALPFYTPLTRGGRGGCSFDEIFQQPRPLENDPHFPAIAVTPETADCGIVRATRGRGFPRRTGAQEEEAFSWDAAMERE